MDSLKLHHWLNAHSLGHYLWKQEQTFFQAAFAESAFQRTLLLGHAISSLKTEHSHGWQVRQAASLPADIVADATHLPWREDTFTTVLAAHLPDTEADLWAVLRELYRVVESEGAVWLTGFNPYSLWRFWHMGGLPPVNKGVPVSAVRKTAEEMGWQVEKICFINYLPPFKQPENWQLVEYAGRYLWTHGAAVYGVILRKQVARVLLSPQQEAVVDFDNMAVLGMARVQK